MLEIHSAIDLPGLKITEIPFVIVSLWGRARVSFTDVLSLVMRRMVYGPIFSDLIWQGGFLHVYHLAFSNPSLG